MENDDLEREAFLRYKAEKEAEDQISSGLHKKKEKKARKEKQRVRTEQRGALNSNSMLLSSEESNTYNYYTTRFHERVTRAKGSVEIEDEAHIVGIGFAMVRLHRKSKLETQYGRFMDRTAPQDPLTQLLQCIKALNLKTDVKGSDSNKEALAKMLIGDEATTDGPSMPDLNDWRKQQASLGIQPIERRSQTEFMDADELEELIVQDSDESDGPELA